MGLRAQANAVWTATVLSDDDMSRVMTAVETVALTGKVIEEVGGRKSNNVPGLVADLEQCIELSGHAGVHVWTRESGGRVRYGVYRERWALDALDFLDRADLAGLDRAWISGLLFAYRPEAIQQFIDQNCGGSRASSESAQAQRSAKP